MAALERQRGATLCLAHLTARRSADLNPAGSRGTSAGASQASALPAPGPSQPRSPGMSGGVRSSAEGSYPIPSPDEKGGVAGAPAGAPQGLMSEPDMAELVFGGATDGGIAVWDVAAAAAAATGPGCGAASGLTRSGRDGSSAAGRAHSAGCNAAGGSAAVAANSTGGDGILHSAPGGVRAGGASRVSGGAERGGVCGAARAGVGGEREGWRGEGAAAEVARALALPGAHQSGVNALSVARCGTARLAPSKFCTCHKSEYLIWSSCIKVARPQCWALFVRRCMCMCFPPPNPKKPCTHRQWRSAARQRRRRPGHPRGAPEPGVAARRRRTASAVCRDAAAAQRAWVGSAGARLCRT